MIGEYNPHRTGRWYKFFIESDGVNFSLTTSDIEDAEIDSDNALLVLPLGYQAAEAKIFCLSDGLAVGSTGIGAVSIVAGGQQAIQLPLVTDFEDATIYVFAVLGEAPAATEQADKETEEKAATEQAAKKATEKATAKNKAAK